jgi:ATP-binding cassette subfamily B protein
MNISQIENEIERYHAQPARVPPDLHKQIEARWRGRAVELYALLDLDQNLKLRTDWLLLGRAEVAHAVAGENGEWTIRSFSRSSVRSVREAPSLSLTRLVLGSEDPEAPLIVARYSHRQRRAVGHIAFCLEQEIKERENSETRIQDAPESLSAPGRMEQTRLQKRCADELYREAILSPVKDAQASVTVNKFAVVWRLLGYLAPYRKKVAFGMAGAVGLTLLSLLPPLLTGILVDRVIRPYGAGTLTREAALSIAGLTIAGLAAVYVLREVFAWIRLRTMSIIGESVASDLRRTVYEHLHTLSLSYFSKKQTGSIISRVSSDTDRIWDFIAFGVVEVTTSVMMLLGLSIVLLSLDWKLGLVVTLPIPLILAMIVFHGRKMQSLFLRAWRKWSALTDCLSDTIPGVRVVKAFGREAYEMEKFAERNLACFNEFERIHQAWTGFWPLLMVGVQLIVLLVWVLGLPRVLEPAGVASLSAGTFISFVLYMTMFMQPIEVIGQMARMVNRATSSAYRVFEVLDTEPQIREEGERVRLERLEGRVRFENVFFSYDGVRSILKNLSFEVEPGEMIGIVGPSGSGKSTIINLLARFYDASEGRVLIDGVDIKDLELGSYRRQVGMVLQDPYLFHGSILDNIRYARPDATLEEVVAAAQAANAHKFISSLTHGYDTIVGERGHTLSGGERQRVSIARAVLLNPRILILDEATSAVDTETERQIQDALDRLVKGRTVFAIAHRLSTLTRADRLLVIKNGRLIEEGRHVELLAKPGGVFAGLSKMQQELHASQVI